MNRPATSRLRPCVEEGVLGRGPGARRRHWRDAPVAVRSRAGRPSRRRRHAWSARSPAEMRRAQNLRHRSVSIVVDRRRRAPRPPAGAPGRTCGRRPGPRLRWGVRAGEAWGDGAARELAEEAGVRAPLDYLGEEATRTTGSARWRGSTGPQRPARSVRRRRGRRDRPGSPSHDLGAGSATRAVPRQRCGRAARLDAPWRTSHSALIASRMSRREARHAGTRDASTPMSRPSSATTPISLTGQENDSVLEQRLGDGPRHEQPEDDADDRAVGGDDDRLGTDRAAPELSPGHADRSQQPDLGRALGDRQDQRVDDAEDGDDDGEGRAARSPTR